MPWPPEATRLDDAEMERIALEIRTLLLKVDNEEDRSEILYKVGICTHCGADKINKILGLVETCYCTHDD